MQWGYSTERTATFPVAFASKVYAAVGCPDTNSTSATATGVHSLTLTGMGIAVHGTKGWYFVVGKQQWGYINNASVQGSVSASLPITLSQVYCAAATGANMTSRAGYDTGIYSVSATTISVFIDYHAPYWIVIGRQQWGICPFVSSPGYAYSAFPISNPSKTFAVLHTYLVPSNGYTCGDYRGVYNVTLAGAYFPHDGTNDYFIVIGI